MFRRSRGLPEVWGVGGRAPREAGGSHAPRKVRAAPCGPPGPGGQAPPTTPAAGPRPGDGGAGRGWLVVAVEKQRDEVTPKRGRRERLKEAENETRRGTVGRKLES